MPGQHRKARIRIVGRDKERKPADVIPMRMGQKNIGLRYIATHKILAKIANAGSSIKNQDMFADADFNATCIPAIKERDLATDRQCCRVPPKT